MTVRRRRPPKPPAATAQATAADAEQRFLARYDPSAFARPSVTADVVVLTARRAPEQVQPRLEVLLVRRAEPPQAGRWALPGGFVGIDESLDDAAARVLAAETGASGLFLEQLHTFGEPRRDPRTRVISVAYWALAPLERVRLRPGPREHEARLHPVEPSGTVEVGLAFDHADILQKAHERLRARLEYRTVGAELLPERFTLLELQQLYEAILGRPLDRPNFRKKLLASGLLVPVAERRTGRHRPARCFAFRERAAAIHPPFRWADEP